MTTSKKIQDYLREHGKMHYTECASGLGMSPKTVSSRIHGMASRGAIVLHGDGHISAGETKCLAESSRGQKGPYRRKVLSLREEDRYVLRQISFEPRARKVLLELYGEDEAAELKHITALLLRRLWIFLRNGKYEITEMGRRALDIIDEDDAAKESRRKKAEARKKATHNPAVVPHMRETEAGWVRRSASPRVGDALH